MYSKSLSQAGYLARFVWPIGCCVLIGLPLDAYPQQWVFEPTVRLEAGYDDNAQLTENDPAKIKSAEFALDATGRFVRRTQSSEIRFAPRIRSKAYSDDSLDDNTDGFLDFLASKTLERSGFGIQARYSQEDLSTAEIDDPDFDNPDVNDPLNLDTGRTEIGVRRDTAIVSPFMSHQFTETIGFRFDANYVDVTYDQNQLSLRDYTNASLGVGLLFNVSDRSTWSLTAFGGDYDAEEGDSRSESQSVGANIEYRHQFSPTMEGRASVGYRDVDSDVTSGGATVSESNGVTEYSASLTRRGDISRVVVDASQTVDPGGTGFVQERTQFRLRYTRQLSPTVSGDFDARIQHTEEVAPDPIVRPDRDYQRFGIGLEWRLSRSWSLRGDYAFTDQEFDDSDGSAQSNVASISFIYEPPRRR